MRGRKKDKNEVEKKYILKATAIVSNLPYNSEHMSGREANRQYTIYLGCQLNESVCKVKLSGKKQLKSTAGSKATSLIALSVFMAWHVELPVTERALQVWQKSMRPGRGYTTSLLHTNKEAIFTHSFLTKCYILFLDLRLPFFFCQLFKFSPTLILIRQRHCVPVTPQSCREIAKLWSCPTNCPHSS